MKIYFALAVDPRVLKDNLKTYKSYFQLWKNSGGQLRWNDIFHGKYRLFFPLGTNNVESEVKEALTRLDATIIDYNSNKVSDKYGRVVNLGRLLQIAVKRFDLNPDLLDRYNKDPARQGGIQKAITENNDKTVVISRHPIDVVSMSTGSHWTSCMTLAHKNYIPITKGIKNLSPGTNVARGIKADHLKNDVEEGTIVAYVVANTDIKTLSNPICRIAIKPFVNSNDPSDIVLVPEEGHYGDYVTGFREVLTNWLKASFKSVGDTYFKNEKVYNDDSTTVIINKKFNTLTDLLQHAVKNKDVKIIFQEGEVVVLQILNRRVINLSLYAQDYVHDTEVNLDSWDIYLFFAGLTKKFILMDNRLRFLILYSNFNMYTPPRMVMEKYQYALLYHTLNQTPFNKKILRDKFSCNNPQEMTLTEVKNFINSIRIKKSLHLRMPPYKLKYAAWITINKDWWLANKEKVLE